MLPDGVANGTIRWFGSFIRPDRQLGGEQGAFAITFRYRPGSFPTERAKMAEEEKRGQG